MSAVTARCGREKRVWNFGLNVAIGLILAISLVDSLWQSNIAMEIIVFTRYINYQWAMFNIYMLVSTREYVHSDRLLNILRTHVQPET